MIWVRENGTLIASVSIVLAGGLALLLIARGILNEDEFADGVSSTSEILVGQADLPAGEITRDVVVGQTFRARDDNLHRVDVIPVTYDRGNDAPLIVSLYENGDEQTPIRQVSIDAASVIGNETLEIEFDPVTDSGGREYLLTFESPGGTPGNAFSMWVGKCDCDSEGEFFLNGSRERNRDLTLSIAYGNPGAGVSSELLNRMSQYKPTLFKGVFLVLIGVAGFGLSVAALAALVTTPRTGSPEEPSDPK